jgi:hypothetical protein
VLQHELVRWLVLNEISDDYENIDQILLPHLAEIGAEYGLTIERGEIVQALRWLIAEGMAKAYLLSGWEPYKTEIAGEPPFDVIEENFATYFYITEKGMDAKIEMDARYDPADQLGA